MKKKLLLALIALLLIACENHQTFDANVQEIKISKYKETYIKNLPSAYLNKEEFIPLERISNENYFHKIDKLITSDKKIFILDRLKKAIYIFSRNGKFLQKLDKNKVDYAIITDFDIDKNNGNILLIDGSKDQFLVYDSNLKLINKKKMAFEADIVKTVSNGNFLFGISSWNKGKEKGSQVILTDTAFNVLKNSFKYDEFNDDDIWVSDYNFTSSNDFIFYNKSINDNVVKFNKSGEMVEVFHFDFGSKMVPFAERKNVETNIHKFKNYRFLLNFSSINDNLFFGKIWDKKNKVFFLLDREKKDFYLLSNKSYNYLNNYINLDVDGKSLISYIAPGEYNEDTSFDYLASDLKNHLANEGFVLSFKTLN